MLQLPNNNGWKVVQFGKFWAFSLEIDSKLISPNTIKVSKIHCSKQFWDGGDVFVESFGRSQFITAREIYWILK